MRLWQSCLAAPLLLFLQSPCRRQRRCAVAMHRDITIIVARRLHCGCGVRRAGSCGCATLLPSFAVVPRDGQTLGLLSWLPKHVQVRTVEQPVSRTMMWVSMLMTISYILRALWLFLKETEILASDDTGCVNQWNCPKIFVTTVNRLGSYSFFVAFSLLGIDLWGRSTNRQLHSDDCDRQRVAGWCVQRMHWCCERCLRTNNHDHVASCQARALSHTLCDVCCRFLLDSVVLAPLGHCSTPGARRHLHREGGCTQRRHHCPVRRRGRVASDRAGAVLGVDYTYDCSLPACMRTLCRSHSRVGVPITHWPVTAFRRH